MQTNNDEVARIILRHQKEDLVATMLLWIVLGIFLISNALRIIFSKKN
jgi:hypothetical protein